MNKSALMERAVHLALKGSFTTRENPNVGCLIYKDGMILSEGWHVTPGSNHAEVNAILNAESKFKDSTKDVLDGSSLFVTLEPCSTEKRTPLKNNLYILINDETKKIEKIINAKNKNEIS